MAKDIDQIAKRLEERVKEISCLYKISKVAQDFSMALDDKIARIMKIIPSGWEYPDDLQVFLTLNGKQYGHPLEKEDSLSVPLHNKEKVVGEIFVAYNKLQKSSSSFLIEEHQLLEQISIELSSVITLYYQQKREEEIRSKLRREDRLNILAELTAGIAHELNTPLGNILGFAEIIQKNVNDPQTREDLRKIITSTLNAREIVKKLMYFSCEMPSNFKPLNVSKIIMETCSLLTLNFREADIKLQTELLVTDHRIVGDELQLTQVFLNLILNAIDAAAEKSTITIRNYVEDQNLYIAISDEGKGIAKEDISAVFQPFYTTKKNGTGLGLSVVHGIVQAHKGSIEVDSVLNKGTTFTIKLPLENEI